MLTHQIIQREVEELKQILTHEDLEIPSFWRCIWPGLVCMLWFLLSSYLSYGMNEYVSSLDRLGSMIFAAAIGVFSTIAIANTRALFLSLPESFRKESEFFNFLSKKCKVYGLTILLMFTCFAFMTSFIGWNIVSFFVLTIFGIVVSIMVMNVDLGRYQLSTFTSVLESVRGKETKSAQ